MAVDDLLEDAKSKVIMWGNQGAGVIAPKAAKSESIKKEVERVREVRLQRLLAVEVEEADKGWADYEMEETQIQMDITDMIMNAMCMETIQILEQV